MKKKLGFIALVIVLFLFFYVVSDAIYIIAYDIKKAYLEGDYKAVLSKSLTAMLLAYWYFGKKRIDKNSDIC